MRDLGSNGSGRTSAAARYVDSDLLSRKEAAAARRELELAATGGSGASFHASRAAAHAVLAVYERLAVLSELAESGTGILNLLEQPAADGDRQSRANRLPQQGQRAGGCSAEDEAEDESGPAGDRGAGLSPAPDLPEA